MNEEKDSGQSPEIRMEEDLAENSLAGQNPEQQETQPKMEVHHHPDLHHRKKKFKEYFLEFLMIFLAVTMGFLAENLRENISKNEREKQLMVLLVEDLKADIKKLDIAIQKNDNKVAALDTLRRLIYRSKETKLSDTVTRKMYYLFRLYGANTFAFAPTARTLNQFDRNDAFSVIRKQEVSDSIVNYREYDEKLNDQLKVFEDYYQRTALETGQSIFDGQLLESFMYRDSASAFLHIPGHFTLLTYDKQTLSLYGGKLLTSRGVLYNYMRQLEVQKQRAQKLIVFIDESYDLENK